MPESSSVGLPHCRHLPETRASSRGDREDNLDWIGEHILGFTLTAAQSVSAGT